MIWGVIVPGAVAYLSWTTTVSTGGRRASERAVSGRAVRSEVGVYLAS